MAGVKTRLNAENRDSLCLDCGARAIRDSISCQACTSRRVVFHPELFALSVAHIDCDAFYAAVEKRDDPSLADLPVIVGGAVRGVVTTACYVARTYGVRSAMPMFKALKACPDAIVIRPNFAKYSAVAREVREKMSALTPLVEPVSIDEAFLDLTGTRRVLRMTPAEALARLQREIHRDIGITVSIGLSCNKFLAKTASDFDKPNGFSIIGAAEAKSVLAQLPVSAIWGVGPVFAERLRRDGFATVGDLQRTEPSLLARRYGEMGLRLAELSQGRDLRRVAPSRAMKSVSSETTFNEDIGELQALEDVLWRLAERTAARMKEKKLVGRVVTLKLKSPEFRTITRRVTLAHPSNLARTAFEAARTLLRELWNGRSWRLIGVGYSDLAPACADAQAEMFADAEDKFRREEAAIDAIRLKFGADAIALGRVHAGKSERGRTANVEGERDDED